MIENLIAEAKESLNVSSISTASYEDKKEILLEFVNKKLECNPRLPELIGYNPLQMMHDNHTNHINFMINVFKFNNFEILVRIVPWVYKAYHAHGFSYDYFIEELNAWKEANNANLQKSEAAEINAIYDWLLEKHQAMIILSNIKPLLIEQVSPEWKQTQEKFLSFLLDGDFDSCWGIAESIIQTPGQIKDFYIQVMQPSLYKIGALWEEGEISVAEEHLSSAVAGRLTANIYLKFRKKRSHKGKVIITSAPNEFHEMGSRMVADLLELDGWNVFYLGANTPKNELYKIIKKIRPVFFWGFQLLCRLTSTRRLI